MNDSLAPPAWVLKRDGSRVAFDADKISQALFAATETLKRPDAFLARELTDGVLHFLALEKDDDTLTTAQIAEIVGKTVRELGQPALAEAFAVGPRARDTTKDTIELLVPRDLDPRLLFPKLVREYAQQTIYSRQVLAAQRDGLVILTGLDTPAELESCVVVGQFESAANALAELRQHVGGSAVFDGPEYELLRRGGTVAEAERFVSEVRLASRFLGLRTVVNLNCGEPPAWAGDLAPGPLFAELGVTPDELALSTIADALLERLMIPNLARPRICIHWHLGERDFLDLPNRRVRLLRVAQFAEEAALRPDELELTFVFDRPRRPCLLAEGIDRRHYAVLTTVGLHLLRLAEQPGLKEDASLFLQKLGSLTRLAISAAVQKREYLRRLERGQSSPLNTIFQLYQARLMVAPLGLDSVVRNITGSGLSSGGAALDFGKQIVTRLADVLKQDGRTAHLDACIDGPIDLGQPNSQYVASLTAVEANAAPKNQLRATGALHGLADGGLMMLILGGEDFCAEGIAKWLRDAWKLYGIGRLRIRPY